jgi:hypothetical protein
MNIMNANPNATTAHTAHATIGIALIGVVLLRVFNATFTTLVEGVESGRESGAKRHVTNSLVSHGTPG